MWGRGVGEQADRQAASLSAYRTLLIYVVRALLLSLLPKQEDNC